MWVLLVILIALLTLGYLLYLKPKMQMRRYIKLLRGQGYRVYEYPFNLTIPPFIKMQMASLKRSGDSFDHYKHEFINYDVAVFNTFNKVNLLLIHPDLIRETMTPDKVDIYEKDSFVIRGVSSLIGRGLLFNQRDQWRHKRKIVSKLFSFDMLLFNIKEISQIIDRAMDERESQNLEGNPQLRLSVKELGARMFSSVILKCFIGVEDRGSRIKGESLSNFIVRFLNDVSTPSLPVLALGGYAYTWGVTPRLKELYQRCNTLKAVILDLISQRRKTILSNRTTIQETEHSDLLEALISSTSNSGQGGQLISDEELVQDLLVFLAAGTDTTSAVLQLIVYYLGKNPAIEKKVRAMVDQVIHSDEDIVNENLKKLPYIQWLFLQSMRINGPGNSILGRKVVVDHHMLNIPVKKGTGIILSAIINQYNPIYFPNPQEFRPERWETECTNNPPFVLLGFSGGPRNCIGKQLALLQAKVALVKILRRYKTIRVPDQGLRMERVFLYEPRGLEIVFQKND